MMLMRLNQYAYGYLATTLLKDAHPDCDHTGMPCTAVLMLSPLRAPHHVDHPLKYNRRGRPPHCAPSSVLSALVRSRPITAE